MSRFRNICLETDTVNEGRPFFIIKVHLTYITMYQFDLNIHKEYNKSCYIGLLQISLVKIRLCCILFFFD